MSRARVMSTYPRVTYGRIFPSISSVLRIGVATSCSNVPSSRSRTMATAVSIIVSICSTTASRPGTMKLTLRRSGLYQAQVQVIVEVGRDDDAHPRPAAVDLRLHLPQVGRPGRDVKEARVDESLDQRPALLALRLVEDDGRQVLDLRGDGVAEEQQ